MAVFLRVLGAQLRRDRRVLALWLVGIALFWFAVASAIATQFADVRARASLIVISVANPAIVFARGLPDGVEIGAVASFTGLVFTSVLAALMSTFLVVRHSRADEEAGRGELLGSTAIARAAPLGATLSLGAIAALAVAVLLALASLAAGLPIEGSIVLGLAIGSVALVFVAISALVAQAMPTGRGANGAAAGLVAAAYLLRGAGDAFGSPSDDLLTVTPTALSWLSPIGWAQATRPFTAPTALPLLLSLAIFVVLVGTALALRSRRDLGASLVPERHGRANAGLGGRSVLGLAWRLQRASLLGWSLGVAVLGGLAGGLAPVLADALDDNPALAELIGRLLPGDSPNMTDVFIAALFGIGGMLSAAAGVQAVLRLRSEEAEGRAELLLSAPIGRVHWAGATVAVSAVSVVIVTLVLGLAGGAALSRAAGDTDAVPRLMGAGLAHAPAALVLVGLTLLVVGLAPRIAVALGWGLLVLAFIVGEFGELLQLPEWLRAASPFFHTSAVPVEELDAVAAVLLLAVAAVGVALGLVALRRRDLAA